MLLCTQCPRVGQKGVNEKFLHSKMTRKIRFITRSCRDNKKKLIICSDFENNLSFNC